MKATLMLEGLLTIVQLCNAYPSYLAPLASEGQEDMAQLEGRAAKPRIWRPVPRGGVRAPCPGTNTLANHGFINRDGKGVTRQAYQQAFLDAFGMAFTETRAGVNGAFNLCRDKFNNGVACTTINIDMLAFPHRVEHDGSLTRDDAKTTWNQNGDNHSFNQSVWDRSLAALGPLGPIGGITHLTAQMANTMRVRRVEQARVDDPGWFIEKPGASLDEHCFYLTTMNDPLLGQDRLLNPHARLDWVNHWFQHEELPTALGWKRPAKITNIRACNLNVAAQPTIPLIGDIPSPIITIPGLSPTATSEATITTTTAASSSTDALPTDTTTIADTTTTADTATTTTSSDAAPADPTPEPVKRDTVPLAAIPNIVKSPAGASLVQEAAAQATDDLPAPPAPVNFYQADLTPAQFHAVGVTIDSYVAKMQAALKEKLNGLLEDGSA